MHNERVQDWLRSSAMPLGAWAPSVPLLGSLSAWQLFTLMLVTSCQRTAAMEAGILLVDAMPYP